ncbi:MAG: segregation/condensation protein A [Deltaproteobacteria bacterium]|nr:segregation/condensation protein A [Deltaproteobacteria bacterium]
MELLLHLIRKNEVDIFDIPIAMITDQYLQYIDMMKALNITVAGEFLVMASTLIHIKSRMLLPSQEDGEEEDPREEITRPLLEYMQLKEMAEELGDREILGRDVFPRIQGQDFSEEFQDQDPLLKVSLFELIDAFKRIVEESHPGAQLSFRAVQWSLKEKMGHIMDRLKEHGTLFFHELFERDRSLSELIVTFLALLELVQIGMIRVFQADPDKDIQLEGLFKEEDG